MDQVPQHAPGVGPQVSGLRQGSRRHRRTRRHFLRVLPEVAADVMLQYVASVPKIPIPFNRMLKIVALVNDEHSEVRALLDMLSAERFEIEVSSNYDRDPSEDAGVGAYILDVDGAQRDKARELGLAVRRLGFRTPIWALADSRRIAYVLVSGTIGEVDGFIYLGQQTPSFYAKQIIANIVEYGRSLLPPFFGGLVAYDAAANISFACPGHQGGQFYRKSPAGQLFYRHFGE